MQGKCVRMNKDATTTIVPIRGDHGDYVCERYETHICTPVQRNNISDIKIDITDDTGEEYQFKRGTP